MKKFSNKYFTTENDDIEIRAGRNAMHFLKILNLRDLLKQFPKLHSVFRYSLIIALLVVFESDIKSISGIVKNETFTGFEHKIDINKACQELATSNSDSKLGDALNPKQNEEYVRSEVILSDDTSIYPVFRWQCVHTIAKKPVINPNGVRGITKTRTEIEGLDLDKYCQNNSKPDSRAFYRDYQDPDSLYCTDVHLE